MISLRTCYFPFGILRKYSSTMVLASTGAKERTALLDITSSELKLRRLELANLVSQTSPEMCHHIIVPGLSSSFSAPDVPHLFRQRASFRYLTGITDPNACLLISVSNPGFHVSSTVFFEETDEEIRIWEGKRMDEQLSLAISGAESAFPICNFSSVLLKKLKPRTGTTNSSQIWFDDYNLTDIGVPPMPQQLRSLSSSSSFSASYGTFKSVSSLIHRLRITKSKHEISLMRYVCEATAKAVAAAARKTSQLKIEFALEGVFDNALKVDHGIRRVSFPPVVACGENATALHYLANEKVLKRGECVLMDAGSEHFGYCSDMCRVWPNGGVFSSAQRSLYEALLSVHERCLNLVRPGVALDFVYIRMLAMIGAAVKELGIIKKSSVLYNMSASSIGRRLCPHHVSHHLGLDVHDCSLISRSEPLVPNAVVTVEPGIYIRPEWKTDYHDEFLGIGMRVEDDIVVQSDPNKSSENLILPHFPINVEFIEKLASEKS